MARPSVSLRNALECIGLAVLLLVIADRLPGRSVLRDSLSEAVALASALLFLWSVSQAGVLLRRRWVAAVARGEWRNRHRWLAAGLLAAFLHCYLLTLSQRDNVREAVLRHEAAEWRVGRPASPEPQVIFVSFDGQDPSDGFVQRFRHGDLRVFKVFQGVRKMPLDIYTEYWQDPATGLKGGHLDLGPIRWLGPCVAQVDVNYPLIGYRDTLVWETSGWVVVRRELGWLH